MESLITMDLLIFLVKASWILAFASMTRLCLFRHTGENQYP